jgi:ABC-type dipeptide/oligopeptide/nickel transport system ATPase subunit
VKALRRRIALVFEDPFSSLNLRIMAGSAIGEPLWVHRLAKGRAGPARSGSRNYLTLSHLMDGQILLGDAVLAFGGRAEHHRHIVRLAPHPQPARVLSQRVERVEHDPIHTVIAAGQQIPIPRAELVAGHPPNLRNHPPAK